MKASIIVPTYNRSGQLSRTIKSLVSLNFDERDYEIIVVDNGSNDDTKKVVEEFIKGNSNHSIKYIYDDIPGLLTGRHRGAKEALCDILVFIDDDIHADAGWLTAIIDTFNRYPDVHLVGGKCLPAYEIEPPGWISYFWNHLPSGDKMLVDLSLCDYGEVEKEVSPTWIWGLNFSIRKNSLIELGGFHPDSIPPHFQKFQGDGETGLSMKMIEKNYKAVYNPRALVHHEVPAERMTLAYFDKRKFYQGVCNSYTDIRRNKGINVSIINYIFTKIIKPVLRGLLRLAGKKPEKTTGRELTEKERLEKQMLEERFNERQNAGYRFHREAALTSKVVLEWVLRENYFDYKLPEES